MMLPLVALTASTSSPLAVVQWAVNAMPLGVLDGRPSKTISLTWHPVTTTLTELVVFELTCPK